MPYFGAEHRISVRRIKTTAGYDKRRAHAFVVGISEKADQMVKSLLTVEAMQINLSLRAELTSLQLAHSQQIKTHNMPFHEFVRTAQSELHLSVHNILQRIGRGGGGSVLQRRLRSDGPAPAGERRDADHGGKESSGFVFRSILSRLWDGGRGNGRDMARSVFPFISAPAPFLMECAAG